MRIELDKLKGDIFLARYMLAEIESKQNQYQALANTIEQHLKNENNQDNDSAFRLAEVLSDMLGERHAISGLKDLLNDAETRLN